MHNLYFSRMLLCEGRWYFGIVESSVFIGSFAIGLEKAVRTIDVVRLQLGMVLEIHILRAWAVGNRAEPHLVVIFLIEMLYRTRHPIITPGLPILPGRPHISTVIPTALSTMPPIISQ